ncbi:MAG TPA: hypothetical protein VNO30_35795 [Kofleriaceae bacterium]|nr:hypothetical protein [Kofleriaceae bacterium]
MSRPIGTAAARLGGRCRRLGRWLCLWLAAVACSPARPAAVPAAQPAAAPPCRPAEPALALEELDELFGVARAGDAPPLPAERLREPAAYRARVRALLDVGSFYDVLTPRLFSLYSFADVRLTSMLETGETRSGQRFYFRQFPCAEPELTRVRPWWSPTSEVLVCPADHRPAALSSQGGAYSCDMNIFPMPVSRAAGCGCGPNLMFCAPFEQTMALGQSVREEIRRTLQHVVASDRPLTDLFATNETVRSGYGELFYARNRFFQTGRFEPPTLDEPARPRPRDAEFSGGLLTTPLFLFFESRREVIASLWQDTMCTPFRSARVDPHVLLQAARTDPALRVKEHLSLASTPGCQNCHSRLEYGGRAFAGWQNAWFGQHYDAALRDGVSTTRFYVRDHTDLRGEGPASPAWLGQMIVAQPEFASCIVEKALSFVYEGYEAPPPVRQALLQRFRASPRLGPLLADAVVARSFGAAALAAGADPLPVCAEAR